MVKPLLLLAGVTRLELAASGLTGCILQWQALIVGVVPVLKFGLV